MIILDESAQPEVLQSAIRDGAAAGAPVAGVIGGSEAMRQLYAQLRRVGPTVTHVLIEGESGTGKEVAAATLHHLSGRTGPFVAINCGSMSAELLDSELFGHARGAFTGATQAREGLFRHAGGGTLFLDEVSELPLFLQAKLLRVIETLMIRPVGSDVEAAVNVRIVAATNRPLLEQVAQGRFREDLFYRLNVITLRMPPLRERPEDIQPLAAYFVRHFAEVLALPPIGLRSSSVFALRSHAWPGNVRELRNLIERATLLGERPEVCLKVRTPDPDSLLRQGGSGYPLALSLAQVRALHMARVLQACNGNKSEAARRMGISRKTLERYAHALP